MVKGFVTTVSLRTKKSDKEGREVSKSVTILVTSFMDDPYG